MDNLLLNASFMDGISAWTPTGTGTLATDEVVHGSEGRRALVVTRPDSGLVRVTSSPVLVANNEWLEVHVLAWSDAGNPTVDLIVGGTAVPIALKRATTGQGEYGVVHKFNSYRARVQSPGAGNATIRVGLNASSAPRHLAILHPYLGRPTSRCTYWVPGEHANPELQLPVWPAIIPPASDISVQSTPRRRGFGTDSGIPNYTKINNQPRFMAKLSYQVDNFAEETLTRFTRDNDEFLFVRPDTAQLCIGRFTEDGDPMTSGMGPGRRVELTLELTVV